MRSTHQDIINSINESGNLDDDVKDRLVGIIEDFKKILIIDAKS
jgi:hypothetical protein